MKAAERFAVTLAGSILVILMLWCGGPGVFGPSFAPLPAETFFPDQVSAAVRLNRFRPAFDHYWVRRGYPETDEAIGQILRAVAPWDEWSEDLSEAAIERRITAFREAFFQLMGPESWLVFGQWGSEDPEEAETALLLFLREGAAVRLAVAPFLDLMLPEKRTVKREYRGVEILQYISKKERDDWTMARIGGWVCVSMRNRNSEALPRIIDQYLMARQDENGSIPPFFAADNSGETIPALSARIETELLWDHVADFEIERGEIERAKDTDADRTERWQRRLRNIDSIEIVQATDALLDLDMVFRGPRINHLERVLNEGVSTGSAPPLTSDLTPSPDLPLSAIQIDFSYPMANRGMKIVGLDWDDFIDELDNLKYLAPGLAKRMERSMYDDEEGAAEARIGAALTRAGGAPFMGITVWRDHPPILYTPYSPADAWTVRALARYRGGGDMLYSVLTGEQQDRADEALIEAQRDLANGLWHGPSRPPEMFLVFNWDEVVHWMDGLPLLLTRRSESFESLLHFSQGMDLAMGTLALRFDVVNGAATLRLRTLEVPGVEPPSE